jgi:hypothetical protein
MAGIFLFVTIFVFAVGGGLVGWIQWYSEADQFRTLRWRSLLGLAGLLAATLQILVLGLFEAYALVAHDFSYRERSIFLWGRVATYLCALALLAALFGKGKFRFALALSALATEAIWFALGMML